MMGPIIHCRMCLHHVDPVLELTPTPIANGFAKAHDNFAMKFPLGLSECKRCGHVQINYNIDGSCLYNEYLYQTPEAERPRLREQAKKLAVKYPDALAKLSARGATTGNPSVLDIGCNNGMFCDELNANGFYAVGVDPASTKFGGMPKWFNSKTARQIAQSFGKMRLLVANNTFAHVDDLRNMLLGVSYLMAPDGHLVFEVQYLPSMVAGGMFDMIYHEHKDYHTLGPWPRLLDKFGMCIQEIEWLPTHGGSVRVHVGFGENGIDVPRETPTDWKAFSDHIENGKISLIAKMEKVRGKIAAFGATAKACTLIHHFGISEYISYCLDETPGKQGRFIPGTSIEICGMERMDKEPPDAILLTAWNYASILQDRFDCDVIVPFKKAA